MCGRYALVLTEFERGRLQAQQPEPVFQNLYSGEWQRFQGYDIRPSTKRPVVRAASTLTLEALRWGWAKRPWANKDHINARWEDGNPKKMFVPALHERRCVVPASAYYEWERDEKDRPTGKFAFFEKDRLLLRMAGIWEDCKVPGTTETESRFLIFTREMVFHGHIHDRTPILLTPAATEVWLDPKASEAELLEAANTMNDQDLVAHRVKRDAQLERDDSPALLDPIDA